MKIIEFIDKIYLPVFSDLKESVNELKEQYGEETKEQSEVLVQAQETNFDDKTGFVNEHVQKMGEFVNNFVFHFRYAQEKSKQKEAGPQNFYLSFIKKSRECIKKYSGLESEVVNLPSIFDGESYLFNSKLETTFLGQKKFYWLTGFESLKTKEQTLLVKYLETYCGPNYVAFLSDDTINLGLNKNKIVIDLQSYVDQNTFIKLADFFLNSQVSKTGSSSGSIAKSFEKISADIYLKMFEVSLDDVYILVTQAYLSGSSYREFLSNWMNKIIIPDKSLFTLSQYFFDRNSKSFLNLWSKVKEDFPEQFWLSFWSEQIWRASNFVKLSQEKKPVDAKKIGFRLPFSFMQKSWRNFTVKELSNAHNFLYLIDYNLKNGVEDSPLDLFYFKFMSGEFK